MVRRWLKSRRLPTFDAFDSFRPLRRDPQPANSGAYLPVRVLRRNGSPERWEEPARHFGVRCIASVKLSILFQTRFASSLITIDCVITTLRNAKSTAKGCQRLTWRRRRTGNAVQIRGVASRKFCGIMGENGGASAFGARRWKNAHTEREATSCQKNRNGTNFIARFDRSRTICAEA